MCQVCGKKRYATFGEHWMLPSMKDKLGTYKSLRFGWCINCEKYSKWNITNSKLTHESVAEFCKNCGMVPWIDMEAERFGY